MSLADLYKKGELKIGDDVIDTRTNTIVTISDIKEIKGNGIKYNIGNITYGSLYGSRTERFIAEAKKMAGGAKKSKKQRNSKRRRTRRK